MQVVSGMSQDEYQYQRHQLSSPNISQNKNPTLHAQKGNSIQFKSINWVPLILVKTKTTVTCTERKQHSIQKHQLSSPNISQNKNQHYMHRKETAFNFYLYALTNECVTIIYNYNKIIIAGSFNHDEAIVLGILLRLYHFLFLLLFYESHQSQCLTKVTQS